MNVKPKPVLTVECERCGQTYMMVGDVAVKLSQHRPARSGRRGVCPDHKKGTQ